MSGMGSRETGLDSLFASKPVGPGFEPCLGQSAKVAGAPKPLCLSYVMLWQLGLSRRTPQAVNEEYNMMLPLDSVPGVLSMPHICIYDVSDHRVFDGSAQDGS